MRIVHAFLILATLTTLVHGQPGIDWEHQYGDDVRCQAILAMNPTADGGYICGGVDGSISIENPYGAILLLKLDSFGDTVWTRSFQTAAPDLGQCVHDVRELGDGTLIMVGTEIASQDSMLGRGIVVKTDAQGNEIWHRHPGDSVHAALYSLDLLPDGGFIIGGLGRPGAYLARLDDDGNTLWEQYYAIDDDEYTDEVIRDIERHPDGSYYACGDMILFGVHFVLHVDNSGNEIWRDVTEPWDGFMVGWRGLLIVSDGVLVTGQSYGEYLFYAALSKYSFSGSVMWNRTYDYGFGVNITPDTDGGYLISGSTNEIGVDNTWQIIKTNSSGIADWTFYHGYQDFQNIPRACYPAVQGGYLAAGALTPGLFSHDCNATVVHLCPDESTLPTVSLVTAGPLAWDFMLRALSQPVSQIVFSSYYPGWTGFVDTTLVPGWHVMTDGNNGDSILFHADEPIVNDSVGPFTVIQPYQRCDWGRWQMYCRDQEFYFMLDGQISCIAATDDGYGFGLSETFGRLDRVVFRNTLPSMTAWATGAAEGNWHPSDYGDSIVFQADIPLASGSVDTFWLSHTEPWCVSRWRVGCNIDSMDLFVGRADSLRFLGLLTTALDTMHLRSHTEANLQAYEIYGQMNSGGPGVVVTTFPAQNDTAAHDYVFVETPPEYDSYHPAMVDIFGCRRDRYDLLVHGPTAVETPSGSKPETFELEAYPNPFNSVSILSFSLPQTEHSVVEILNLLGRHVATVHDGMLEPGEYRFAFDGSNLPSGIYFARLEAGEFSQTKKLMLLK